MLGMLRNPPEPFEDVIRTHFKLKARSIIRQLDEWLALDDGKQTYGDGAGHGVPHLGPAAHANNTQSSSSSGFQKNVGELKKELRKLLGEEVSDSNAVGSDNSIEVDGADEMDDVEVDGDEVNDDEMPMVDVESALAAAVAVPV